MKNNEFDRIAPYYDLIGKIVFGNILYESSRCFLSELKPGKTLILGAGTGRILDDFPPGCEILYLEKSARMISKARSRNLKGIKFVKGDFLQTELKAEYTNIVCPFFLDVFGKEELMLALDRIGSILSKEGQLFVADFQHSNTLLHRFLLWVMHRFFSITVNLQSTSLQSIHQGLIQRGYIAKQEKLFRNGFIFSRIYQK